MILRGLETSPPTADNVGNNLIYVCIWMLSKLTLNKFLEMRSSIIVIILLFISTQ